MSGAVFSLCLVSFVLFGGIYYITPHYNSQSENLATAMIGTEECGAKTNYSCLQYSNNGIYIRVPCSSYSPQHV